MCDQSYERKLLRFTTPDLLIVDDLGLGGLRDDEPMDHYEFIRQRDEQDAAIITSNRDVDEWPPLFGDGLLAGAAIDRLLRHPHLTPVDGDSFQNLAIVRIGPRVTLAAISSDQPHASC